MTVLQSFKKGVAHTHCCTPSKVFGDPAAHGAISRHLEAPSQMDMEGPTSPWHTTQDHSKNPKPSHPILATIQSLQAYKNHSKDTFHCLEAPGQLKAPSNCKVCLPCDGPVGTLHTAFINARLDEARQCPSMDDNKHYYKKDWQHIFVRLDEARQCPSSLDDTLSGQN
ncbi:hypothetical protein E2C01_008969 [Portunus trituberculatus]|uniref:Uncharacterized protein n=1 Tax=Portunus trituberculatus TaxID=210409 RepID=A0A5B7D3C4_PORTR|nr:hypothetical protein [Portunus trituberculatus]